MAIGKQLKQLQDIQLRKSHRTNYSYQVKLYKIRKIVTECRRLFVRNICLIFFSLLLELVFKLNNSNKTNQSREKKDGITEV